MGPGRKHALPAGTRMAFRAAISAASVGGCAGTSAPSAGRHSKERSRVLVAILSCAPREARQGVKAQQKQCSALPKCAADPP